MASAPPAETADPDSPSSVDVSGDPAANVIEKIKNDCLTCRICHGTYARPKALPCLHTFCLQCLSDYIFSRAYESLGKFPCPLCRADVDYPKGGAEALPDNHLVINLQDAICNGTLPPDYVYQKLYPTLSLEDLKLDAAQEEASPRSRPPTRPPLPSQDQGGRTLGRGQRLTPTQPSRPAPPARAAPPKPPRQMRAESPTPSSPGHPRNGQPNQTNVSPGSQATIRNSPRGHNSPRVVANSARPDPPPRPSLQRRLVISGSAYPIPMETKRHGADISFGRYGTDLTDFTTPVGLAVSPEGYIVVSDERQNRVFVFEQNGTLKTMFTCQGHIHDVAVNKTGHLYVANSDARESMVICYNLRGQRLSSFGNFFTYEKPHGIAVKSSGQVVVSSTETNLVYTLAGQDGKLLQKFLGKGKDFKNLRYPYHVAVTGKDLIVVSDHDNDCVKIFDTFGKCKIQFGKRGKKPGELRTPRGVCVDSSDNIVVADYGNRRVQVFSRKGEFLGVAMAIGREEFDNSGSPLNVAMSDFNSKLVVLVRGANFAQVRVYKYKFSK